MKKKIIIIGISLQFLAIIALFWYNDWIYSLPTPTPAHYKTVQPSASIDIANVFPVDHRPLFLHFFNPDCPCSRFNIPHFRSLVQQYGKNIRFAVVVMTQKKYTVQDIQGKFDMPIPVSFDTTIAVACGVYSTPQAVILDANRHLYYRGNYNKSRYCTDSNSNYARIALDGLLHGIPGILFDRYALTAYGCRVPNCYKQ